jgi:negative regulator of sigma E activity
VAAAAAELITRRFSAKKANEPTAALRIEVKQRRKKRRKNKIKQELGRLRAFFHLSCA